MFVVSCQVFLPTLEALQLDGGDLWQALEVDMSKPSKLVKAVMWLLSAHVDLRDPDDPLARVVLAVESTHLQEVSV